VVSYEFKSSTKIAKKHSMLALKGQVAQLSQRDRATGAWVKFGQK